MDLCPHPPSMRAHSVALTYAHTSARGQMHTHTLKVPTVLGFTSMESPKQVEGLPSIDVTYPQEVHNNCLMNCHETARAQSNTPRARVCTYTHTHTHTYIRMHACMHTCIHTYMHACMHTYIHTYTHTHPNAQTHTHTHAPSSWPPRPLFAGQIGKSCRATQPPQSATTPSHLALNIPTYQYYRLRSYIPTHQYYGLNILTHQYYTLDIPTHQYYRLCSLARKGSLKGEPERGEEKDVV